MEDFYYYEAKNLPWFLCMFNEENRQSTVMKLLTGDFFIIITANQDSQSLLFSR